MKKSVVFLLIAVLVAGFAFAGKLSGSAGLYFEVDLAEAARTWGFVNSSTSKYSFSFEYDSTKVEVAGSPEMWAELAIDASASLKVTNSNPGSPVKGQYSVNLKKAEIHIGQDLYFGILNEGNGVDFAKTYKKIGSSYESRVKDDHEAAKIDGFTVNYKDWYGGFGAKGNWIDEENPVYTFYGHARTPEFKFAEDQVIVQVGGYGAFSNTDTVLSRVKFAGVGAKAEYKSEKLPAFLGVDFMYDDATFFYEAQGNVTYNFNEDGYARFDVYAVNGKLIPDYAEEDGDKPALDAKLSAGYGFTFEKATLDLDGFIEIENAFVEDFRELTLDLSEVVVFDAFKLSFEETYLVFAKKLDLSARVEYTHEKFSAYAEICPCLQFADSEADALYECDFKCGISSTAVIDKAEIGLTYKRADFASNGDSIVDPGLITAYVEIAF